MKLSKLKTNAQKSTDGVWVNPIDDLQLKLARLGNEKFQQFVTKNGSKIAKQASRGNVNMDDAKEVTRQAVSRYVLLDWKNLKDDDGSDIPYSQEKAYELLGVKDFYDLVLEWANDMSLFQDSEDAKGN